MQLKHISDAVGQELKPEMFVDERPRRVLYQKDAALGKDDQAQQYYP